MDIKHNTKPVLPRLASQRIQKRHLSLFSDPPLTNDEWKLHHTWVRHLPDPKRFIKVLAGLWPIVAWSILTSVAAGLYYELAQEKHGWPVAVSQLYVEPFVLTSFAVSLLLVFRTNSSYDRWWEARKDFGRMYNCARNLARMTGAWVAPNNPAVAAELYRWCSVLVAASTAFLRQDHTFLDSCADCLSPDQLAWLKSSKQPPVAATQVIAALTLRGGLNPYERAAMMDVLTNFDIALGACERIRSQPIPMAYTRHTSRFLICFITFLPFGLWGYTSWLTIPVMAVITFLLVGTENIGIQIEQPMLVLPLEILSAGTKAAVEAMSMAQGQADRWAQLPEDLRAISGVDGQAQGTPNGK